MDWIYMKKKNKITTTPPKIIGRALHTPDVNFWGARCAMFLSVFSAYFFNVYHRFPYSQASFFM